jgi:hypothetical protein
LSSASAERRRGAFSFAHSVKSSRVPRRTMDLTYSAEFALMDCTHLR